MLRSRSLKGIQALLDLDLDLSLESSAGNNILQEAILTAENRIVDLVLSHIGQDRLQVILTHKNKSGQNALELPCSDKIRQSLQSHWLIVLSMEGNACYKEGAFGEAVDRYTEALALCDSIPSESRTENLVKLEYNCARALFRQSRFSECISHCSRCIELDPSYLNAYSQTAQARVELLDFLGAKKEFETLISLLKSGDARQVNELRLKILELEQELRRDHYTILGIERFTTEDQQIKSAYRQLARKFHPDKVMGEAEDVRVRSRNQFARIQTAYEILTGPNKDEYDMGLRIQIGADSVRQSLLMRRRSSCSPPQTPTSPSSVMRQMRMRSFLGSEEGKMSRSFDVLFRN
jgi:tetratricopeptide (TPR) repeat protein